MKMDMLVGERRAAAGAVADPRSGPYAEMIVNDVGLGRYFEANRLGRVYSSFVKTVTIAATHNTPLAAATGTPVLGLLNPTDSGMALVFLRASLGTVSGTPAGGQAVINAIGGVAQSITATQTGNIFANRLSYQASPQGSVCQVYNNVALTGLSPIAGREVLHVGQATAAAAAGNGGPGPTGEDLGGLIIAPPGFLVALMAGTGAGTTWIVNASWTWAEVEWPL